MAKRRNDDPFDREPGVSVPHELVDEVTAASAILRFADAFVLPLKRERARTLLSRREPERRIRGLQALEGWVHGARPLGKADSGRLSNVRGILIDDRGRCRVTLGDALILSGDRFGALWIADVGDLAVLMFEIGQPCLCTRP